MCGRISTAWIVAVIQIIVYKVSCETRIEAGILIAQLNGTSEWAFCLRYFPEVSTLPSSREDVAFLPLADMTSSTGCDSSDMVAVSSAREPVTSIDGKIVALGPANCSFVQKAVNAQRRGAVGVIVVIPPGSVPQPSQNESDFSSVNISLTVISDTSMQHIQSLGSNVRVLQYAPIESSHMDYSLVVIWFMAVISIILGSVWSRSVPFYWGKAVIRGRGRDGSTGSDDDIGTRTRLGLRQSEEDPLIVSSNLIVCFVVCMCGMLLLLYFFYEYLVYVIIFMFCLAATAGLYQCLEPFVLALPCGRWRLPTCNVKRFPQGLDFRQALLLSFCIALTITWFIYRKESYAWVLQDILGIAFTINLLRIARLPSFKICTILLVLLFFYDIFFVFITPLLTKNGESVMVEVATGGNSQEQMPMVLKVPHMGFDPLAFCSTKYSMLGFGDMLVPGLLVAYCYSFDVDKDTRKVYFFAVVTAYGIGLIITFAGLYLMANAQPALLYLVPCMLGPVVLISLCRREFRQFWTGRRIED